MKLSELLKDVVTTATYMDREITDITEDSRKVKEGSVFVCIKGDASDGHSFALKAVENGAAAVVAERDTGAANQILVGDSRDAYARMCASFFGNPAGKLKLIGVTGTNGKTSVSYFIKTILEHCGYKVGLIGTVQNMIGKEIVPTNFTTPDAYSLHALFKQMADADCDYCVMEVSSQALAQGRVIGCKFEVSVFTNLTQDHLDYHKSMENYREAKKLLFKNSKTAVINFDDGSAQEMTQGLNCRIVTYSAKTDEADYTARNITLKMDRISFELLGLGKLGRIKLSVPGLFTVYNALAASICALEAGIPFQSVIEAMSLIGGVKGRMEIYPTEDDYTIVIDYAHTPDGLENVLRSLKEIAEGRIVTVFGCGGDRDRTKRPIMGRIASQLSDFVVVTSDNPRTEDPMAIIEDVLKGMDKDPSSYTVIENRRDAIKFAIENKREHDIILLAGKGHETYQILNTGKIDFDERTIIADILREHSRG